mmetsp:Transcript_3199/g.7182  ORF Transcript_3199/g.7182 Transcript_3199/m.7182 type:complete len:425 (-) Transcript_3199:102-1376(-)
MSSTPRRGANSLQDGEVGEVLLAHLRADPADAKVPRPGRDLDRRLEAEVDGARVVPRVDEEVLRGEVDVAVHVIPARQLLAHAQRRRLGRREPAPGGHARPIPPLLLPGPAGGRRTLGQHRPHEVRRHHPPVHREYVPRDREVVHPYPVLARRRLRAGEDGPARIQGRAEHGRLRVLPPVALDDPVTDAVDALPLALVDVRQAGAEARLQRPRLLHDAVGRRFLEVVLDHPVEVRGVAQTDELRVVRADHAVERPLVAPEGLVRGPSQVVREGVAGRPDLRVGLHEGREAGERPPRARQAGEVVGGGRLRLVRREQQVTEEEPQRARPLVGLEEPVRHGPPAGGAVGGTPRRRKGQGQGPDGAPPRGRARREGRADQEADAGPGRRDETDVGRHAVVVVGRGLEGVVPVRRGPARRGRSLVVVG